MMLKRVPLPVFLRWFGKGWNGTLRNAIIFKPKDGDIQELLTTGQQQDTFYGVSERLALVADRALWCDTLQKQVAEIPHDCRSYQQYECTLAMLHANGGTWWMLEEEMAMLTSEEVAVLELAFDTKQVPYADDGSLRHLLSISGSSDPDAESYGVHNPFYDSNGWLPHVGSGKTLRFMVPGFVEGEFVCALTFLTLHKSLHSCHKPGEGPIPGKMVVAESLGQPIGVLHMQSRGSKSAAHPGISVCVNLMLDGPNHMSRGVVKRFMECMTVSLSTALAAHTSHISSSSISSATVALLTLARAKACQLQQELSRSQHDAVARELVDLAGDVRTRQLMDAADMDMAAAAYTAALAAATAAAGAAAAVESCENGGSAAAGTEGSITAVAGPDSLATHALCSVIMQQPDEPCWCSTTRGRSCRLLHLLAEFAAAGCDCTADQVPVPRLMQYLDSLGAALIDGAADSRDYFGVFRDVCALVHACCRPDVQLLLGVNVAQLQHWKESVLSCLHGLRRQHAQSDQSSAHPSGRIDAAPGPSVPDAESPQQWHPGSSVHKGPRSCRQAKDQLDSDAAAEMSTLAATAAGATVPDALSSQQWHPGSSMHKGPRTLRLAVSPQQWHPGNSRRQAKYHLDVSPQQQVAAADGNVEPGDPADRLLLHMYRPPNTLEQTSDAARKVAAAPLAAKASPPDALSEAPSAHTQSPQQQLAAAGGEVDPSAEMRRERRKQTNRDAAKRSRALKMEHVLTVEKQVEDLQARLEVAMEENERLRGQIRSLGAEPSDSGDVASTGEAGDVASTGEAGAPKSVEKDSGMSRHGAAQGEHHMSSAAPVQDRPEDSEQQRTGLLLPQRQLPQAPQQLQSQQQHQWQSQQPQLLLLQQQLWQRQVQQPPQQQAAAVDDKGEIVAGAGDQGREQQRTGLLLPQRQVVLLLPQQPRPSQVSQQQLQPQWRQLQLQQPQLLQLLLQQQLQQRQGQQQTVVADRKDEAGAAGGAPGWPTVTASQRQLDSSGRVAEHGLPHTSSAAHDQHRPQIPQQQRTGLPLQQQQQQPLKPRIQHGPLKPRLQHVAAVHGKGKHLDAAVDAKVPARRAFQDITNSGDMDLIQHKRLKSD